MNKQELIAKIAKDTGRRRRTAAQAVDSLIDGITKALKKGDSVTFVGFGTFKTSQRKARTARNPQTGAAIKIPKRRCRALQGRAKRSRARSTKRAAQRPYGRPAFHARPGVRAYRRRISASLACYTSCSREAGQTAS